jgi:hypothetical protein
MLTDQNFSSWMVDYWGAILYSGGSKKKVAMRVESTECNDLDEHNISVDIGRYRVS